MTLTTSQAFVKCLEDLTLTEYQRGTLVPARKASVDENLTAGFPSTADMPFDRSYLIGSAPKGTIIRPMEDVDVLAVFSNERGAYGRYQWNSRAFIYRVRQAYAGFSVQQVGTRGQAVRVFFKSGGYVDVAPVFWEGGDDYLLPAGDGKWLRTAPFKANKWLSARNLELSYNLKPLVRFLKAWNRAHSRRLKSFHLETMAASVFSSLGTDRPRALRMFFDLAPHYLDVQDPGGHSGNLSSYLSLGARNDVRSALGAARDRADLAIAAQGVGNHAEARRQWRMVLGDPFPR